MPIGMREWYYRRLVKAKKEEQEQELAIFLPLERFKKASKSKVWADSTRMMGA